MQLDFSIYAPNGPLVAAFKAKAIGGGTPEWAAEYRRNLIRSFGPTPAPLFGFITPDKLFLWREREGAIDRLPDAVIDIAASLGELLGEPGPVRMTGEAFKFLVGAWLGRLTMDWIEVDPTSALAELQAAIRGGDVRTALAA